VPCFIHDIGGFKGVEPCFIHDIGGFKGIVPFFIHDIGGFKGIFLGGKCLSGWFSALKLILPKLKCVCWFGILKRFFLYLVNFKIEHISSLCLLGVS
jgi:hypothetical protein